MVVPTYGRADALAKAIESLLGQTYDNLEVIIVDDNEPSSSARFVTQELVQRYVALDDRVRYLSLEKNVGGSLARNAGVAVASGELVTFLDDDDFYLPNKIERQVSVFRSTGCDICTCAMYALDKGKLAYYIRTEPFGQTLSEFLLNGSAFTPMIMVRRELFLRVGGFVDTPRFQDHLLMLRLFAERPKVQILNERLFVHVLHLGGRVSHSNKTRQAYGVRHKMEVELSYCLSGSEKLILQKKQDLDILECDLLELGCLGKVRAILSRVKKISSMADAFGLVNFAIRKELRRNYFVWWVRRMFLAKSFEGF